MKQVSRPNTRATFKSPEAEATVEPPSSATGINRGPDLTFLVALVMSGVVAAMKGYKTDQGKNLGDAVIGKIKDAVDQVQF
jgi:hypothetical protein